ncbi:hypothetical protein EDB89DRAFT_1988457 [Lactarius sanguifluus]|nr:hypothetical protein EDB89DRAFT_1988457 [Lactarius sanguifluus]
MIAVRLCHCTSRLLVLSHCLLFPTFTTAPNFSMDSRRSIKVLYIQQTKHSVTCFLICHPRCVRSTRSNARAWMLERHPLAIFLMNGNSNNSNQLVLLLVWRRFTQGYLTNTDTWQTLEDRSGSCSRRE